MKPSIPKLHVALMISAIAFAFGCASSDPSRTAKADADGRVFRKAESLERVWLADGFNFKGYDAVLIAPVTTGNVSPKDDKEAERLSLAQIAIARDFALALEACKLFPSVLTKESDIKPGSKVLKLENAVVKFSRGSTALRVGIGMGAGSPYIRIQGQMTEAGSNKPLFIYEIDETGDWFGATFASSRTLQTQAASELADDVVAFMARVAKGEKIKYR